jgi:uncharacterized protein
MDNTSSIKMALPQPTKEILIIKQAHSGKRIQYGGRLLPSQDEATIIEAIFELPAYDDGIVVIETGDRFIEWFYTTRWYNIFQLHGKTDNRLKGWYCNFTYPAEISEGEILWKDLALDLWVSPSGQTRLLDEREYEELPLPNMVKTAVTDALQHLLGQVKGRQAPFHLIEDVP